MAYKQNEEYNEKFISTLIEHQPAIITRSMGGVYLVPEMLFLYMYKCTSMCRSVYLDDKNILYVPDAEAIDDQSYKTPVRHYIGGDKFILALPTSNNIGTECSSFTGDFFVFDDMMMLLFDYRESINNGEKIRVENIRIYHPIGMPVNVINDFLKEVSSSLVFDTKYKKLRTNRFNFVSKGGNGFDVRTFSFNDWNSDIKKNYNDDLPYDKIKEILKSDKQELVLFSGEAGTGKTSLIKSIINDKDMEDVNFYYIDPSLFSYFNDSAFISFLNSRSNSVVILEDCEKLLMKREQGNPLMNVILNMTDGIIGEALKIKFLCTFNCDESKLDQALLRKGRLSLKYEFKKLDASKVHDIMDCADKPMTLAELYHYDCDNGNKLTKRKKIGF